MAQHESFSRNILGVSTMALNVLDIDSALGFMHMLFAQEDAFMA